MLVDKARAGGGDVDGFRYTSNGSILWAFIIFCRHLISFSLRKTGVGSPLHPQEVRLRRRMPRLPLVLKERVRTHLIFPFSFSTKFLFVHPSSVCRTHLHRLVDLPSSKAVDCGRKTHLGNRLLVPYHAMCREWDSWLRRKMNNASHYSAAACFRFPYIF